jgi:hypothetical protein
MRKNDSELLAELYTQVRHDELLNEGIANALKNKLVDWAMSTVAQTIKRFAPEVYDQLRQARSAKELQDMITNEQVSESSGNYYEPQRWDAKDLMRGGSEGFSPEEMEILSKRRSKVAMPEKNSESTEQVKSAVQKFMDIVKKPAATAGNILKAIGIVIATIAVIPLIANPVGIFFGILYLKTRGK